MSEFFGDIHDFVDHQGTVIRAAPCRNCSRNLLGLNQSGRCPNCGAPIAVSVCGDYLRFAHPHWLSEVASGIMLILWGMLITFVLAIVAGFVFAKDPAMQQFLAMAGSALGMCGAWMMTRRDPSGIGETKNINSRQLVRAAAIASLTAAVIQFVVTLPGVRLGSLQELALIAGICGLVTIVGEFAKLQYLQRLAARLPEETLVWRAGGLKWALALTYGVMILAGVVAAAALFSMDFSDGPRSGNIGGALGVAAAMSCLALPAGIVLLVITVMIINLLYRTAQAIRAQIPLAKEAWRRSALTGQVAIASGPAAVVSPPPGAGARSLTEADEPFGAPLPAAWSGTTAESAPVVPLKVAHLVCESAPSQTKPDKDEVSTSQGS